MTQFFDRYRTAESEHYFEYDDAKHAYYVNGREVRSVTQIMVAAGLVSRFVMNDAAAARGQLVHELCAVFDRGEPLRVDPEYVGYVNAWIKWRGLSAFQPELIEHRVDCLDYNYCGRLDRAGLVNGVPAIVDIKTNKDGKAAATVALQLAAYGYALDPKQVFARYAVVLKPGGMFNLETWSMESYHSDVQRFLHAARTTA